MSGPISVIPIDTERLAKWRAAAGWLRDFAERVEAGELRNVVVIWDDATEPGVGTFGEFEDRWRLLGAIEYAKGAVE